MINEFTGNRNFKLVLCQNDLCEAILRLVVWEVICYELSSWYLLGSFDFTPVETLACSPSLSFCHSSGQATCPRESAKSGSLLDSWILDLQIYAVTPIPESQEVLQREGVPDNIKSFYKVNHIWKFRYDRPFHKGTKDKENEFKVLSNSYDTWFPQIFFYIKMLVKYLLKTQVIKPKGGLIILKLYHLSGWHELFSSQADLLAWEFWLIGSQRRPWSLWWL